MSLLNSSEQPRAASSEQPRAAASQPPASSLHIAFDNSFARLPQPFFSRIHPTPVAAPKLVCVNAVLARELGIDAEVLASDAGVAVLAGNTVAPGSEPLAMAYAGHQFGHFVPQLGDGRANLLGEIVAPDWRRVDLQLKGSGPTPYSRRGDGRAALGPVLREYLLSEAMAALGVPTTRALAAVTTGETVYREGAVPGAVFARVASSHLRVGTFQYFAAREDVEALRVLADYAIGRHDPGAANSPRPYRSLLEGVVERQAKLIAQWLCLGFVHGVMNTDNMSIPGETIDYGPCAFLEAYDPDQVFSSIDRQGRYAYSNQPHAAHWNLTRLAEAMLPLLVQEEGSEEAALVSAREALAVFAPVFEAERAAGLCRKVGLQRAPQVDDVALAEDLLQRMAASGADFTLTFDRLTAAAAGPEGDAAVSELLTQDADFGAWAVRWRSRMEADAVPLPQRLAAMRLANPVYIPRNHQVEAALNAAVQRQDFGPFHQLLDVVTHPFSARAEWERYTTPARPEECVRATFCGT